MENNLLSRAECNALRGLAIIGIVLHNYCHWLRHIVRENEYQYFQRNVDGLVHAVGQPDALLPIHLLSFFGHYGVPVFLFLSAYGLVMKYERKQSGGSLSRYEVRGTGSEDSHAAGDESEKSIPRTSHLVPRTSKYAFLRVHFLKLFKMMFVGYVAFTIVDAITPGSFHNHWALILAQLGMVNNLLPNPDDVIWPGPYWFFGLMLQLYAIYRLLLYRRHWGVTVGLMVVCTAAQMICGAESSELNYLRYNFVGGMLPFGLGLLYARYGKPLKSNLLLVCLLVSLCLTCVLSMSYYSWFFVPLFILTGSVAFIKVLPASAYGWMEWVGSLSAALFVCHPITRKVFIPVSHRGDVYTGLLLYILASIALAWLFRELMKRIPNPR